MKNYNYKQHNETQQCKASTPLVPSPDKERYGILVTTNIKHITSYITNYTMYMYKRSSKNVDFSLYCISNKELNEVLD